MWSGKEMITDELDMNDETDTHPLDFITHATETNPEAFKNKMTK